MAARGSSCEVAGSGGSHYSGGFNPLQLSSPPVLFAACPAGRWVGGAVAIAAHKKIPGYQGMAAALWFSLAAVFINELGSDAQQ